MTTSPDTAAAASQAPAESNLLAEVATVIVAECLEAVDADAGFVATISDDGGALEVWRVTRYSHNPVHLTLALDSPYPLAETVRLRRPLFITSNEQLACDHPGLVRVKAEDHACATMPLFDENGEVLGAINLGFDEPHVFSGEEVEVFERLGRHCADAMSLARRVETETAAAAAARRRRRAGAGARACRRRRPCPVRRAALPA